MTLRFRVADRLLREVAQSAPPPRDAGAPHQRQLRVYSVDPTFGAAAGGVVTVAVPFENLALTVDGRLANARFVILPPDDPSPAAEAAGGGQPPWFSLDTAGPLAEHGYPPSLAEPRFIVQMVYAVAMSLDAVFRDALGRLPLFGLDRTAVDARIGARLVLHPWAEAGQSQALYDREKGEVRFGYYDAKDDARGYPPDSRVYTALSHDIIVHELSHAYLDGVFPHLMVPLNDDTLAFHEAFADLMAVFQRMAYSELVRARLAGVRGRPGVSDLLTTLAEGFARTATGKSTLRQIVGDRLYPDTGNEPHERGEVLVQAVFRAFSTVLERRFERLVDLASGGTGVLRGGALPPLLLDAFARVTVKTARMFQTMLIRGLDYCPPLGASFFDVLRAVVTADFRLVPGDSEGVREAWMEAFRFHRIFPAKSRHFSDEALALGTLISECEDIRVPAMSFSETRFSGNPGEPVALDRALTQAGELASALTAEKWSNILVGAGDEPGYFVGDDDKPVEIVSIRSFARPGPGRMTEFGTVVQLLQKLPTSADSSGFIAAGAATLVFDSQGRPVALAGRRANEDELSRVAKRFSDSKVGSMAWQRSATGARDLRRNLLGRLCGG